MNKKWNILICDPDFKPCPDAELLESCMQTIRDKGKQYNTNTNPDTKLST